MKKKIILLFIIVGLAGCNSNNTHAMPQGNPSENATPIRFKKAYYGTKWPFSLDEIEVYYIYY